VSNPTAWLTPDTIPTERVCLPLLIPDDEGIIAAVVGALVPLLYVSSWEQFGTVTPAAMVAAMQEMFGAAVVGDCGGVSGLDIFQHLEAVNVAGGGILANTDSIVPFNTALGGGDGNVTISASSFIVQPGRYNVRLEHTIKSNANAGFICWFRDAVTQVLHTEGYHVTPLAAQPTTIGVSTIVNVDVQTTFELMCRCTQATATNFFGVPRNVAGHSEVYGFAVWERLGDFV